MKHIAILSQDLGVKQVWQLDPYKFTNDQHLYQYLSWTGHNYPCTTTTDQKKISNKLVSINRKYKIIQNQDSQA